MSQHRLVAHLVSERVIRSACVRDAMLAVDRYAFVNPHVVGPELVYEDAPQYNGQGQTISAPHMHAMCLEHLHGHLTPGARVLDVGSGSGYLTACMALMVGEDGYVVGIEKMRDLAVRSVSSITSACPNLALTGASSATAAATSAAAGIATSANPATTATTATAATKPGGCIAASSSRPTTAAAARPGLHAAPLAAVPGVEVIGAGTNWAVLHGNVLSRFLEAQEPFAAIHVGAAAEKLPDELVTALKPGGRMVIPVGPQGKTQVLMVVDKGADGAVSTSEVCRVHYVPLTRPDYAAA